MSKGEQDDLHDTTKVKPDLSCTDATSATWLGHAVHVLTCTGVSNASYSGTYWAHSPQPP